MFYSVFDVDMCLLPFSHPNDNNLIIYIAQQIKIKSYTCCCSLKARSFEICGVCRGFGLAGPIICATAAKRAASSCCWECDNI